MPEEGVPAGGDSGAEVWRLEGIRGTERKPGGWRGHGALFWRVRRPGEEVKMI